MTSTSLEAWASGMAHVTLRLFGALVGVEGTEDLGLPGGIPEIGAAGLASLQRSVFQKCSLGGDREREASESCLL